LSTSLNPCELHEDQHHASGPCGFLFIEPVSVELLLLLLLLLLLFHKLCTIYVIAYGMIMKYVRI